MSAPAYRGREPVLLLQDSVFRVRQLVQTLSPGALAALHADPYVAPSAAGVDAESEYAFCATPDAAFVWRAHSASPTCYTFRIPRASDSRAALPVLLPRPLNDSAEPALLLANARGEVRFWDVLSDAFTTPDADVVTTQLPLEPGEALTAAARIDVRRPLTQPSQAVLATSAARLFRVHAYVHRGEHHLAHAVYTEHKGLLRRLFHPATGAAAAGAVSRLAVGPAPTDALHAHVYALGAHAIQVWRVPLAGAGAASHHPRHLADDDQLHKTIASRALYARGTRYSAAAGAQVVLVDAVAVAADCLVLLYADRSTGESAAAYGLALVAVGADGSLSVAQVTPLAYRRAADPRAAPRLAVSDSEPRVAFVAFDDALVTQLLTDAAGAVEESVCLKPGANRVLGAGVVPVPGGGADTARWVAQTATSGLLLVDVDVAHAQQLALAQQPTSPTMHAARVARLQERLERAVWFGEDAANPLQLDVLPDTLDTELLQAAAERISAAIVAGRLASMRPSVDLRAALAQRVACCVRLVGIIGQNGYLMRLARTTRFQLRCDAELLAGASDLWRFFDDGVQSGAPRAAMLPAAIHTVLGARDTPHDTERFFFEHEAEHMPALLGALLGAVRAHGEEAAEVVETTRLVLALRFGAARYRAEHGEAYALEATPAVAHEPWFAHASGTELLETLFRATLHALAHGAPNAKPAELRTQLCALAEFAMDTYDARLAFLAAAAAEDAGGAAAPALEATRAAYDHARPALLHPLMDVGRADKAFALAEQHRDFRTLTALCFAEARDEGAKRAKHTHPSAHEAATVRVEEYLDRYGMPFATELYQYYVQHGAYRRLFEPQPEHAALVSAFLEAHPQYRRLAWVHDVLLGRFAHASDTLRDCARAERDDLRAKQAMLSLGKLAHLATLPDLGPQLADAHVQAALEPFDDALDLVHVQRRLHDRCVDAAHRPGAAPEAVAERAADVLAPRLAAQPALRALFVRLATPLVAGHVASGEDLVDVLTLQDAAYAAPSDAALSDFAIAAQVYVRLDAPPTRRDAALATLWRRLYLQDDWAALSATAHRTDQAVLDEVRGTVAYATVQAVLANDSTAPVLLSPEQVCAAPVPPPALLAERFPGLPDEQVEQLHAALAAEHAQLCACVEQTKLGAFFAQVLAEPVPDTLPAEEDHAERAADDAVDDAVDDSLEDAWAPRTLPGGAAFDAPDDVEAGL